MHVLIAGGGIGGLTAALACHHFGHQVTVLEQAPALGKVGAGIQISPNGMRVLNKLGVADAVSAQAFRPEAGEMRIGTSGRRVFQFPLGDFATTRWGQPYLHIHRADLISALEGAVASRMPDAVRLGQKVIGYEQNDDGVVAHLADGSQLDGDLLIGADGIHSAVREQMLGPDAPDFTGNVAWRAVVPMERLGDLAPPPTACIWVGGGGHAVTYRLRQGRLANLVGVVERADWTDESWTAQGSREEALADFAGWHPIVTQLIEQADTHFRWALFDRKPLSRWVDGRVALLGDACHPMLPFMAQGAVQAMEDAYVLARRISEIDDVPAALADYETQRKPRTSAIQRGARKNATTFHHGGRLNQLLHYGPMWLADKLAPSVFLKRNDALYGNDVTA